jgi:hypothetical protein
MRWPLGLSLGLALLSAGCRSNCDLVEAELRTRNNDLRELKSDFSRVEAENEALVRELQATRQGAPAGDHSTYSLKQITLARQTGGITQHDSPGDDALQLVLEPRDSDGHVVKAPGTLHVEAYEIAPGGVKNLFSSWEISADQLRRSWHSGLWSSAYTVVLPWKNWPTTERIRVLVRLTGTDGRVFETDKDVAVHLAPEARRKTALPQTPPVEIIVPPQTLPQPHKLDGPTTSKAWWNVPENPVSVQQTALWHAHEPSPLVEPVGLLKPIPLPELPDLMLRP